ncbi:MAG: NfeD family protein [Methylococcales bacterium]|jgi:inner membrane protein|nr:NfeD family protein [Methylococcales bacterium]
MEFLDYFTDHHDQLLYLLAGISLVIELTVLGMSGPLLFFAIACFITAILSGYGVVTGWENEVLSVGVLTGIITLLLWKPLKQFQNSGGGPDTSSDMIGQKVPSTTDITATGGSIRYSGINWNARLDTEHNSAIIEAGALCEITKVDGNLMVVKPC